MSKKIIYHFLLFVCIPSTTSNVVRLQRQHNENREKKFIFILRCETAANNRTVYISLTLTHSRHIRCWFFSFQICIWHACLRVCVRILRVYVCVADNRADYNWEFKCAKRGPANQCAENTEWKRTRTVVTHFKFNSTLSDDTDSSWIIARSCYIYGNGYTVYKHLPFVTQLRTQLEYRKWRHILCQPKCTGLVILISFCWFKLKLHRFAVGANFNWRFRHLFSASFATTNSISAAKLNGQIITKM